MRKRLLLLFLIAAITSGVLVAVLFHRKLVRVSESPDGRYKVNLYRKPSYVGLPGQGGDASGELELIRVSDGSILQKEEVELVYLVDQIEWGENDVFIPPIALWTLD